MPSKLIGKTTAEIRKKFGAVTSETQLIEGEWQHRGRVFGDALKRIYVDVPDSPDCQRFFMEYKPILKGRFKQIDIWIASWVLDVL